MGNVAKHSSVQPLDELHKFQTPGGGTMEVPNSSESSLISSQGPDVDENDDHASANDNNNNNKVQENNNNDTSQIDDNDDE